MTATIRTKRTKHIVSNDIAERRARALEHARQVRAGAESRRGRFQEKVPNGPKPLAFHIIRAVTIVLVGFGLVMVLSSSSIHSFHRGNSPWHYFSMQAMYTGFGVIAAVAVYKMPTSVIRKLALLGPYFAGAMMLMAFIPKFGTRVNGARAWIHIGEVSLQPSEFMKIALIVAGAALLEKREAELGNLAHGFIPYLKIAAAGIGISAVQSDIGSCAVMLGIVFAVMFLAGVPLRPLAYSGLAVGTLGFLYVRVSPDKMSRLTSFLDLKGTRQGDGYQVYQALISLSNGGLTGTGIGAGTGKWGYVPLSYSDFIFSTVAEEMGFLGVIGLLLLFVFLIFFAFQIARSSRDRFGFLIAGGIGSWFLVQICINIFGVVGWLPVTGLTLPFISYGGSSMIASLIAVGLLLNVARRPR